jgi:C1A family cysteine protease
VSNGQLDVRQVQAHLTRTAERWQAAENRMTRLPPEQAIRHLGGALGPDDPSIDQMESLAHRLNVQSVARRLSLLTAKVRGATAAPLAVLPTEVDWRAHNGQNYVTSVKFQGACGTCTCFSSAAATESAICIATSTPPHVVNGAEYPDLSEAQMFYCGAASQGRNCDAGWFLPAAFDFITTNGVAPESYFPYTSGDQSCGIKSGWQSVVTKITGQTKMATPDDARTWLVNKGPIAAMLIAYQDLFTYATGVYRHVSGERLGIHSVCIVGFSDTQQAWLCKNSWSDQWGEKGFFWMEFGQCGIESAMRGVNGFALIDGKPPATT